MVKDVLPSMKHVCLPDGDPQKYCRDSCSKIFIRSIAQLKLVIKD